MPNSLLRPALANDETFFRALYHRTREQEFQALSWPPEMLSVLLDSQFAAQTAGYAHAFPGAETFAILSEPCATEPVGRLILHRSAQALRLVDIALVPSHQNQGLGTRLIAVLQARARIDALPLQLQVEHHNPALALYLRTGFTRCSEDELRVQMVWHPATEI